MHEGHLVGGLLIRVVIVRRHIGELRESLLGAGATSSPCLALPTTKMVAHFVPGDRLTVEVSLSFNLSDDMIEFLHKVKRFEGQAITAIVGDSTGRHAKFELPRAIFNYPGFSLPDTGSIPVEFSGTAFESDFGDADELTVSFI